jgi:ABC-2 type transport system permease protein
MSSTEVSPTSAPRGVTLTRVIRSEAIKLTGLRSTWWLLGSAAVVPAVMTLLWTLAASGAPSAEGVLAAATPSSVATVTILVLLGVMLATEDAENHAAIQTFTVVPQRLVVVWAKCVIALVIGLVVALLTTLITFALADLVLGGGLGVWTPDVLRVLLSVALFETCATLIALAAALIVRSTIAAVGVVFGFFYVVPLILGLIPIDAVNIVGKTIPGAGSTVLYSLVPDAGSLGPGVAIVTMIVWTAAWILIAAQVVRRRNV